MRVKDCHGRTSDDQLQNFKTTYLLCITEMFREHLTWILIQYAHFLQKGGRNQGVNENKCVAWFKIMRKLLIKVILTFQNIQEKKIKLA